MRLSQQSMRMRTQLSVCALAFALLLALTACKPRPELIGDRFLYVVSCEGRVDKLDTVAGKLVETFDIVQRIGSSTTMSTTSVAPSSVGVPGLCWAARVLHDVSAKQVHIVTPTAQLADSQSTFDFQLLTFSLPEWSLTSSVSAGKALTDAPFISRDAQGAITLKADAFGTSFQTPDFSGYEGRGKFFINEIVESSGDVFLLSMYAGPPNDLVFGLANTSTRTLKVLPDLPPTTRFNAHLAPGGRFVVVEVTKPKSDPVSRTGELQLFDGNGTVVANLKNESVSTMDFLALSPSGSAIYRGNGEYRFVPLGRRFMPVGPYLASASVTSPLVFQGTKPELVFFDQ